MGVPKKHGTKSKTRKRRSHHALTKTRLVACKKCGAPKLPHRACKNCGAYGNKESR